MIELGRNKEKFFKFVNGTYVFKTPEEYEKDENTTLKESKSFFQIKCL